MNYSILQTRNPRIQRLHCDSCWLTLAGSVLAAGIAVLMSIALWSNTGILNGLV